MLNIYLVCEWKLFSADDWSSDCRCHGCVSCVQFSVRIRWDLCSTLSPLPVFILPNLHMNVWVYSLLEVLTVCSQWEHLGRHMAAGALIAPTQWARLWGAGGGWESVRESAALLLTIRINCSLNPVLFIWKTYNENNGSKCLKFLPYFYNHLQNY